MSIHLPDHIETKTWQTERTLIETEHYASKQMLRSAFGSWVYSQENQNSTAIQRLKELSEHDFNLIVEDIYDAALRKIETGFAKIKADHEARLRIVADAERTKKLRDNFDAGLKRLAREGRAAKRRERKALIASGIPKICACEIRPRDSKGALPHKVYSMRIAAEDVEWIENTATSCGKSRSSFCLGTAMGWWSPPTQPANPSLNAAESGKTQIIALDVHDDEWDTLQAGADWWHEQSGKKLDPIQFAVQATLGRAKVRVPGPGLCAPRQRRQITVVGQVFDLAKETPLDPPMSRFETLLEKLTATNDTAIINKTQPLFEKLKELTSELEQGPDAKTTAKLWRQINQEMEAILSIQTTGE